MTKSEFLRQLNDAISADELMKLLVDTILEMLPDEPTSEVPQEPIATDNVPLASNDMIGGYFASNPTPAITVFRPIVPSTIAEIFSHIESNQQCVVRLTVHPNTFKSMDIEEIAKPMGVSSECDKLSVWGATISVNELVPLDRVHVMDSWCKQYCVGIK